MKFHGNDRTLEAHKAFPYIAWTVVIGFTFFVYSIAMELKTFSQDLQNQNQLLQEQFDITLNNGNPK